jgi:type II secretory ATPase GspE/PulE/Tfp pilus assembly ATPase PilB-like protein
MIQIVKQKLASGTSQLATNLPEAANSHATPQNTEYYHRPFKVYLREKGYPIDGISGPDKQVFETISKEMADFPARLIEFLKDVAAFYKMPFLDRCDDLRIDDKTLERIGTRNAKAKGCVPVTGGMLLVCDPYVDVQIRGLRLTLTTPANVHRLLQAAMSSKVEDIEDPTGALNDILERAVIQGISDVHIEPREGQTVIRFRQDGILKEVARYNYGLAFHERLINKIYELSQLEASRFGWLSDSSFTVDVLGRSIFVRVSSVPVPPHASGFRGDISTQSSVVLRLLYRRAHGITPLDELGYSHESVASIKQLIRLPYGIIFMAGPTGSGKTTTLYSMMDIKRKEPIKIVAIEDPVEMPLDGVIQVEVCRERDITFASAVRSFLRQDPDVILVGEVRDIETAEEAVRAALTGHLVFATIHANTAAEVIPRLLNLGIDMDQMLSCVKGCIAQRLVRKLCPKCRRHITDPSEYMPIDEFKASYGDIFEDGFWVPVGCPDCDGGYKGRTVMWEILLMTPEVKDHVVATKGFIESSTAMRLCEQKTMRENAIDLIRQGVTSIEEAERFVPISKTLGRLL